MQSTIKYAGKITTMRTVVTKEEFEGTQRVMVRAFADTPTQSGVVATLAMDPDVAREFAHRILAAVDAHIPAPPPYKRA